MGAPRRPTGRKEGRRAGRAVLDGALRLPARALPRERRGWRRLASPPAGRGACRSRAGFGTPPSGAVARCPRLARSCAPAGGECRLTMLWRRPARARPAVAARVEPRCAPDAQRIGASSAAGLCTVRSKPAQARTRGCGAGRVPRGACLALAGLPPPAGPPQPAPPGSLPGLLSFSTGGGLRPSKTAPSSGPTGFLPPARRVRVGLACLKRRPLGVTRPAAAGPGARQVRTRTSSPAQPRSGCACALVKPLPRLAPPLRPGRDAAHALERLPRWCWSAAGRAGPPRVR